LGTLRLKIILAIPISFDRLIKLWLLGA